MRGESGQSMTEFAVSAASLALLVLGTLTLSAYQEVDRRGLMAARELAYRGTWRDALPFEIPSLHRSYLADSAARDPFGRQPLAQIADLRVTSSVRDPDGLAGTATGLLLTPLRVSSGFLGADFDLRGDTLLEGQVQIQLPARAGLPEPFSGLDVSLNAPFALLGDAWNASGIRHVAQRAGGLVPSGRLADLRNVWRPLLAPLTLLEPSLGQFCPGLIEGDRIPENRLGSGSTPLPGGRCP